MNEKNLPLQQYFQISDTANEGGKFFFEHYKLYVDSMEKLVARRQTAQSFFLAANASLLTLIGFLIKGSDQLSVGFGFALLGIALAGCLISIVWSRLYNSFYAMSCAKFAVIHAMEAHLPAQLFLAENHALGDTVYTSMTKTERGVAFIFMIFYLALLTFSVYFLIMGL